jgi:ABC-type branched-subunit amino acid transport system substrate-binding protein
MKFIEQTGGVMKFDHAYRKRGVFSRRLGRGKAQVFALLGASLGVSAMTAVMTLGSGGVASATTKPHAASPIVVCEVSAQSGAALGVGIGDLDGVTAYVKWINAHGGVLGRKYSLTALDDASTPSVAVSDVRKCVTQIHANFILGPGETDDYVAAIPVSNSLKTVLIEQGAGWSGIGIPTPDLTSYAFPGFYNAYYQNDLDFIHYVIVPRHYTKVAVIDGCDPLCDDNINFMKANAKQYGYTVVAGQSITYNQTDDAPQVIHLLAAHPQAIVLGIPPFQDTVTFLKALRAEDPTIPVGECAACTISSFYSSVGGYTTMKDVYVGGPESMLLQYTPSATAKTDIQNYIKGMTAVGYGTSSDISSDAVGWESGMELTAGIKAAGSIDESAVKNALAHQTITLLGWGWARTPTDYEKVGSYHSVMAQWTAAGKLVEYAAS